MILSSNPLLSYHPYFTRTVSTITGLTFAITAYGVESRQSVIMLLELEGLAVFRNREVKLIKGIFL